VKEFLMSSEQAALDLAPTAIAPTTSAKPPEKFTYALPAFTVHRSDKLGAGSRLIQTAIPNAAVDYHLDEDGARCRINLPLDPQGS
jgi:hypothetical protein